MEPAKPFELKQSDLVEIVQEGHKKLTGPMHEGVSLGPASSKRFQEVQRYSQAQGSCHPS
jgi:hypothetical protein